MARGDHCGIGLTTSEALVRLASAIKAELDKCQCTRSFIQGFHTWVRDAYHHNSPHSMFCWTSIVILSLEVLFLLLFHIYDNKNFRSKSPEIEIFLLFLFLLVNVCLVGWDSMLRHAEMHSRCYTLLHSVKECQINPPWEMEQYSNLHTPQSPCISVQWTYRDNQLVNLPCHLLVEGDIILLRPGHVSPGECQSVDKHLDPPLRLCKGTVFAPVDEHSKKGFSSPRFRKPSEPSKFIMLETPYQENLRLALRNSLKRPATLFNKECHTIVSLEHIVIPSIMMVILCIGVLRAAYLNPVNSEWTEHILLRPALVVLPLLPLTLPTCWIVLNAYGMAYLLTVVELSKQAGFKSWGKGGQVSEEERKNSLGLNNFHNLVSSNGIEGVDWRSVDPFEEMEEINSRVLAKPVRWTEIKDNFVALLFSQNGQLWRSANILQVLGSLTALCCVDKKGILSWPNPTAEKVFFLKSSKSKANSEDSSNLLSNSAETIRKADSVPSLRDDDLVVKKSTKLNRRKDTKDHIYHPGSQVEVLDLTHNVNRPFGIQFDDPNWKSYIGNLKPLGLGILCNTCNPAAQQHYSKFCDHIACESLYNDAAVPVVNKRCLCELAKQIGFASSVMDFYELQQQIGVFRHVRPEVIQKGRLARSLNFPRLKMPFPNISCAVVKDLHRGSFQMFSQGTADLILDACNEYWDGEDISLLTESDRKRILDFYHRSSLTAHCMGYAYSPLNSIPSSKLVANYIELPPDSSHLFPSVKNINSSVRSWNHPAIEGRHGNIMNRYLSSDSLLLQEQDEINHNAVLGTNAYLQQLGNEIFIGMVTMQYQACPDFVQLIEQLDKACIRFVHFSKENELRSRVFSEKMGLESGWNCHISLLSEKNGSDGWYLKSKAVCETPLRKSSVMHHSGVSVNNHQKTHQVPLRCVSAPSVVNLDMTIVKFEDEISVHSKTDSFSDLLPMSADDVHEDEIGLGRNVTGFQQRTASSVEEILMMDESNLSHSPSRITESTDQSAPVTFDMSNRAKLPKGTENIRPHIENVDNVPLQVSLFTDCTPEATREMICIMQEYGEVVCCLGSSANCQNMPIFLQADVSIAIEPLYPQLCMQQPVFGTPLRKRGIGPTELSSVLNSLPCALNFHREDPVNLHHLIMEARHFLISMRNSFQFMLCCCLSVTLLQILSVIFIQPLIFTPGHVLWLVCLEIPLLSLSLLGNTMDPEVTTLATGKNTKVLSKQTIMFFMACFGAKFCPSVVVALSCFALIMADFCQKHQGKVPDQCWMFLDVGGANETVVTREAWYGGLSVGQNVAACLTVIYLVFISVGFIRRSDLLWKTSLLANKHWLLAAPTVVFLQLIFSVADVSLSVNGAVSSSEFFQGIPYYIWLIGFLWPLVLIPLNEAAKKHEIKVNVRQQKKARLEFCTKLGMNSPF